MSIDNGLVYESENIKQLNAENNLKKIKNLKNIKSIFCHIYNYYAIDDQGTCYSWSSGTKNPSRNPIYALSRNPEKIFFGQKNPKIISISAGLHHTLFLSEDGEVFCMGKNKFGQLGIGSKESVTYPIQNSHIPEKITKIATWEDYSLFLDNQGIVYACGSNSKGNLGSFDGPIHNVYPFEIEELSNYEIKLLIASDYLGAISFTNTLIIMKNGLIFTKRLQIRVEQVEYFEDFVFLVDEKRNCYKLDVFEEKNEIFVNINGVEGLQNINSIAIGYNFAVFNVKNNSEIPDSENLQRKISKNSFFQADRQPRKSRKSSNNRLLGGQNSHMNSINSIMSRKSSNERILRSSEIQENEKMRRTLTKIRPVKYPPQPQSKYSGISKFDQGENFMHRTTDIEYSGNKRYQKIQKNIFPKNDKNENNNLERQIEMIELEKRALSLKNNDIIGQNADLIEELKQKNQIIFDLENEMKDHAKLESTLDKCMEQLNELNEANISYEKELKLLNRRNQLLKDENHEFSEKLKLLNLRPTETREWFINTIDTLKEKVASLEYAEIEQKSTKKLLKEAQKEAEAQRKIVTLKNKEIMDKQRTFNALNSRIEELSNKNKELVTIVEDMALNETVKAEKEVLKIQMKELLNNSSKDEARKRNIVRSGRVRPDVHIKDEEIRGSSEQKADKIEEKPQFLFR